MTINLSITVVNGLVLGAVLMTTSLKVRDHEKAVKLAEDQLAGYMILTADDYLDISDRLTKCRVLGKDHAQRALAAETFIRSKGWITSESKDTERTASK